MKTQSKHNIKS